MDLVQLLAAGDTVVNEMGQHVRLYCRWDSGGWVGFDDDNEGVLIPDEDVAATGVDRIWWLDDVA